MKIETVGDLIAALQKFPATAPVLATWESITRDIAVYSTPSGTVLVDADDEHYRDRFESGAEGYRLDPEAA